MKNKKKKFFAALAIGVLALSGFAVSASAIDDNTKLSDSYGFKEIKENPLDFVKTAGISVPANFDYILELNKEFAGLDTDKFSVMPGDSLKQAEKEADR